MFKHYLNFKDFPLIGKIRISEPFGFDGQTHKVKKEDQRYGLDITLGNEKIKLRIYKDHFEYYEENQALIDGTIYKHLTHGFEFLSNLFETKGWESDVEYIIQKDNIDFITGIVDYFTINIKEDFIEFSIIQNTEVEKIKRREDVYINAFNNKDLDGNAVTPCSTSNILLKAKPINQSSSWESNNIFAGGFATVTSKVPVLTESPPFVGRKLIAGANNCNVVTTYGVENTLSFIDNTYALNALGMPNEGLNFTYIEALEELTNVNFSFTEVSAYTHQLKNNHQDNHVLTGSGYVKFVVKVGASFDDTNIRTYILYQKNFGFVDSTPIEFLPSNFNLTIPLIKRGERVWIFLEPYAEATFDTQDTGNLAEYSVFAGMNSMKLNVSLTSTAIDSVIKGVRLINLLKHNVKSISNNDLIAPIYDEGGEHYNNFAFNGYLIAKEIDKEFSNTFKDLMNIPKELNGDYKINKKNVEIKQYPEFYPNKEIASFIQVADEENSKSYNKKYFLKQFEYGYEKSSFGRSNNSEETLDDVHTETQWLFPSVKTDGILKISLKHIRSAFLKEEQRRKIIRDKKSAENDEKLFLIDVVELPENSRGNFSAVLKYYKGKILSNNYFPWDLLGFEVGDTILVNGVSVVVSAFEDNLLSTTGNFGTGESILEIDYPLTNVKYVNRTFENFDLITGITNPSNYSNLRYHIKRNIKNYLPYLATAGMYLENKDIKKTLFRLNDKLVTRLNTENEDVADSADISLDDISDLKILTPIMHDITVYCDYEKATKFFKNLEDEQGFVRVSTIDNKVIKGYVEEATYEWNTNKLILKLEEKHESDFMIITKVGNVIYINEVGYNQKQGLKSFEINNNFVSLYDINNILLSNILHFEKIKINGVTYVDKILFSDALTSILV